MKNILIDDTEINVERLIEDLSDLKVRIDDDAPLQLFMEDEIALGWAISLLDNILSGEIHIEYKNKWED